MCPPFVLRIALVCSILVAGVMPSRLDAATMVHYLMFQGNFDTSTPAVETYKLRVEYDTITTTALQSGSDLLTAVFGPRVVNGAPVDKGLYYSGNSTMGITYQYFAEYDSYFVSQFTLFGNTLGNLGVFDGNYWNYEVAGGSGLFGGDYPFLDGETPVWTTAFDGSGTRNLENGSFDGWSYGSGASTTDADKLPTTANFSGTGTLLSTANGISVYYEGVVPEPSRMLLCIFAFGGMTLRRTRRRPLLATSK